jgi:hypothetical protein
MLEISFGLAKIKGILHEKQISRLHPVYEWKDFHTD